MTVGSGEKTKDNVKANRITEVYDHSTSLWTSKAYFPFAVALVNYQILPSASDFIIFGGFDNDKKLSISTVAKFGPIKNVWTKIGNLQFSRHGFGAVEIQKHFLVMGGEGKKRTEICVITGEKVKCKSREPTLNNFLHYPAMMVIETEYTERCKNFSMVQKTTTSTTKSLTKLTTKSTTKLTTKSLINSTITKAHKGE